MALVQSPVALDRQPQLIELVEREHAGPDRALQHRRVDEVEPEAAVLQQPPRLARLAAALLGQVDVGPTGEPVLLVPGRFAVTEQNDFMHVLKLEARDSALVASCLIADRPGVLRGAAELFFDAQQLVVLRDAIAARCRAGLDLPGRGADREIGDRRILGLARAMRRHAAIARVRGDRHRVERLGDRADLVHLDEQRVADRLRRCLSSGSPDWSRTHRHRPAAPCRRAPSVSSFQPCQSCSAQPSSIEMIGYCRHQST